MLELPNLTIKKYKDLRHEIRSGDILLCSGHSAFSTLIQKATNSIWSHVGFILRIDAIDRIMVLESVESIGVRTIPLSSYVRDYNASGKGYEGTLMLARHKHVRQENITKLSRSAVDLFGYPYGTEEIVRIATRISMYTLGMHGLEQLKPQREFICSEYAHECFKSIGIDIPYNPMGFVAPADFANAQHIEHICFIESETSNKVITPAVDTEKHSKCTA